ncbi:MAG: hypothetical protein QF475_01005 [Candidatus Undinarchaeales archaeon]|nr:hypothetical protein [Candidatus Undinarchaeales archaeon]
MTTCPKCKLEINQADLVICAKCNVELHKGCSRTYGPKIEKKRYCRHCRKELDEDNPTWVGMG